MALKLQKAFLNLKKAFLGLTLVTFSAGVILGKASVVEAGSNNNKNLQNSIQNQKVQIVSIKKQELLNAIVVEVNYRGNRLEAKSIALKELKKQHPNYRFGEVFPKGEQIDEKLYFIGQEL